MHWTQMPENKEKVLAMTRKGTRTRRKMARVATPISHPHADPLRRPAKMKKHVSSAGAKRVGSMTIRDLARLGAQARITQIAAETAALKKEFPDLAGE